MSDLVNRSGSGMATPQSGAPRAWPREAVCASTLLVVIGVIVTGGLLRLGAAGILTPHVDEGSSLLAAHAVVDRGFPILPSGTVYLQGATLSYLVAPFVWLGHGELTDLSLLRTVMVGAGVIGIWLAYRLGALVTGRASVGVAMAALVALDPLSIQWSAHLRMYGLLQPLTIGLALAWFLILARGATWSRVLVAVTLFWAAIFTHVGAAMLGPALFISALVIYHKDLPRQGRVLLALTLSAAGAGALAILNLTLGSASVGDLGQKSTSRNLSFVGDNLLAPFANWFNEFEPAAFTRGSNLFWLIPGILVAIATCVSGYRMIQRGPSSARIGAIVVLTLYWFPMVVVGLVTSSPKERYVLNSHILGYLFVAVIMVGVLNQLGDVRERNGIFPTFARVFSVVITIALLSGTAWRLQNPVVHPDHNAAMEYVAAHHEPGEPVIVALPAIGYLAMNPDDRDDLYFLAGEQNQTRARRYTRYTGDGKLIDYWVGIPAMVNPTRLTVFLNQNPNAWIVVDHDRLTEDWAYEGVIENILRENTVPVARTAGGGVILRPTEPGNPEKGRLWAQVIDDQGP